MSRAGSLLLPCRRHLAVVLVELATAERDRVGPVLVSRDPRLELPVQTGLVEQGAVGEDLARRGAAVSEASLIGHRVQAYRIGPALGFSPSESIRASSSTNSMLACSSPPSLGRGATRTEGGMRAELAWSRAYAGSPLAEHLAGEAQASSCSAHVAVLARQDAAEEPAVHGVADIHVPVALGEQGGQ